MKKLISIACIMVILSLSIIFTGCSKVSEFGLNVTTPTNDTELPQISLVFQIQGMPKLEVPIPTERIIALINNTISTYSTGEISKYIKDITFTCNNVDGNLVINIKAQVEVGGVILNLSKDVNVNELINLIGSKALEKQIIIEG